MIPLLDSYQTWYSDWIEKIVHKSETRILDQWGSQTGRSKGGGARAKPPGKLRGNSWHPFYFFFKGGGGECTVRRSWIRLRFLIYLMQVY